MPEITGLGGLILLIRALPLPGFLIRVIAGPSSVRRT